MASPCPLTLSGFAVAGKCTAGEGVLEVRLDSAAGIRCQGFTAFPIVFYLETMKDLHHHIPSHIDYTTDFTDSID